jgi:hypothetical protein
VTKFGLRSLFEFDSRDTAFEFASACFDEMNTQLADPVARVVIAPAP